VIPKSVAVRLALNQKDVVGLPSLAETIEPVEMELVTPPPTELVLP
jgi:hypothetical protein